MTYDDLPDRAPLDYDESIGLVGALAPPAAPLAHTPESASTDGREITCSCGFVAIAFTALDCAAVFHRHAQSERP